jgi:flavodoxin I
MKLAIFYGSTYGVTEEAADRIAALLAQSLGRPIPVYDVARTGLGDLARYDVLVLGCSTWNIGELQGDWDSLFDPLRKTDFTGKRVALFGAGDQEAYSDTFQDALGILAERVEAQGGRLIGRWPVAGYSHSASRAQHGDYFVGLALDEENQRNQTEERIGQWTQQLVRELGCVAASKVDRPRLHAQPASVVGVSYPY